jgi:hypothetical protein
MKFPLFPMFAAALGLVASPIQADPANCLDIALSVKHEVKASPSDVLEIVEKQIGANEDCACEIVKAAIQAIDADERMVAQIVEVAATTAPEKMRLIAQCAIAVAPDCLAGVQAVMAKIDPNRGEGTSSPKGGLEKAPIAPPPVVPNPLDFPMGDSPVIIPHGVPPLPPGLPPTQPPIVVPPVTDIGLQLYYPILLGPVS